MDSVDEDTIRLSHKPAEPSGSADGDINTRPTNAGNARPRRFRRNRPPQSPQQRRRRRTITLLVTLAVLVAIIVPSILGIFGALADYSSLKTLGLSGVHHLLAAKDDLQGQTTTGGSGNSCAPASATPTATATSTAPSTTGGSSTSTSSLSLPTTAELQAAQTELQAAQGNFKTLQNDMNHPDWILSAGGNVPGVGSKLGTARAMANAGYDVSTMGIELLSVGTPILARLHGGALGSSPLLTQTDLNSLQHAVDNSLTMLGDVQVQLAHINLNDLPVCAAQKAEFTKLTGELPRAKQLLTDGSTLIQPMGWLLGVGQARHFLVQTLDRTELRPSGGFAGEWGIVTIQDSKVLPFSLYNVDQLDYRLPQFGGFSNGWTDARRPPSTYSWWPIANWGLRDSNLSADFPTNAKLVMNVFKNEGTNPTLVSQGSQHLDGVINITPIAIAHVLKVTGSLFVPGYNVTVTDKNLEDLIHYYQLDPAGQAKNLQLYPQDGTSANARKRFAQLIARLLEDRVRHLPLSELLNVAKQVFLDMQSRDIGVYFTNPTLEDMLTRHHASGAIDTTPGIDGFFVTHTNWSAGKVNAHVNVNQKDDVTLDDKGGATHHLTISINDYYVPNAYGDFVAYYDHVRVYVPPSAQLLSADGFNTTQKLCTFPHCAADPYPGGELVCPNGNYNPGPRTYTLRGNDRNPPLYVDGGPTQTTSDVPGRTMWGGDVMVPMGCTGTITLSWHVPNVATSSATATSKSPAGAYGPYALEVQRQGGTLYGVQVTLHPAPHVAAEGTKTVTYNLTSDTDLTFTFGKPPQPPPPFSLG